MSNNNSVSKVEAALNDLKKGKLIIVADSPDRESEGDMVGLADFVTPESVNYMIKNARGLLCVPMSKEVAHRLDFKPMTNEHDAFGTAFTISTDAKTTTTGISAFDRADTIKKLSMTDSQAADFYHPGHIFPLIAKNNGVMERGGHTEAAVDLARLAQASPVAYICEVVKDNGRMARLNDLQKIAKADDMELITIADIKNYRYQKDNFLLQKVSDVDLPTKYGHFRLAAYQYQEKPVLVIYQGKLKNTQSLLLRIHSECFTGDILGSKRCDCGEQLEKSLQIINESGQGALIYLDQEGRGIGLLNKLKAYQLQDQGLDTVEANVELGFAADQREYGIVANFLQQENISSVRLLTNNPDKLQQLEDLGIKIDQRVPLEVVPNENDRKYLQTKKHKFNHLLNEVE
ncbi:GTP cyclohydrolase II [Companilactobacillus musae]|uniref:GTP cyclohydrolase II n=1 Tax=Companilactobacillus musae TaxID=1903258 RepID=UPI000E648629|nr:GTP cyclohydrolase II [Companilactobacillus musae]